MKDDPISEGVFPPETLREIWGTVYALGVLVHTEPAKALVSRLARLLNHEQLGLMEEKEERSS